MNFFIFGTDLSLGLMANRISVLKDIIELETWLVRVSDLLFQASGCLCFVSDVFCQTTSNLQYQIFRKHNLTAILWVAFCCLGTRIAL